MFLFKCLKTYCRVSLTLCPTLKFLYKVSRLAATISVDCGPFLDNQIDQCNGALGPSLGSSVSSSCTVGPVPIPDVMISVSFARRNFVVVQSMKQKLFLGLPWSF